MNMKTKPNRMEKEESQGGVVSVKKNLYLFGEINPMSTGMFIAALQEADSEPGMITVSICSGGGWVEGGLVMYDAIRSAKNQVLTIACGAVYSAAVLPFEAGDFRIAYKSSRLFFHDISLGMPEITLTSAKTALIETQNLYKLYCSHVANRSGLTYDKVSDLLLKETYVDVNAALKLNLLDSVISYKKAVSKPPAKVAKVLAKTKPKKTKAKRSKVKNAT